MALYKILFMPSTKKDLKNIPKTDRNRIIKRINSLAINPRPPGCKRLVDQDYYRIRQGDYRIIYSIQDIDLIIWVVEVGNRKDIYRAKEEKEKYNTDIAKSKNKQFRSPKNKA